MLKGSPPMSVLRTASLAALALTAGCVSDSYGYAPQYPPGYDSGMGSGNYYQPGDLFGGQNVADVRVFYEPLAPYGDWVQSQFGQAFRPRVDANWRPYVNGQWGENRLWLSNDPWGWATDHYGRWGYDQRIGWVWVPGTEWAPSWVAWREDEAQQVAGWAPVPPGVAYSVGVGFGSALAYNAFNDWYAPSWVWVPRANLYSPGFGGGVLPWNYGQRYWGNSRWNHNSNWYGRPPAWNNNRPPNWNNGRPPGYNNGRPPGYNNGRPPQWNGRPPGGNNGQPLQWNGRPPGNTTGRPPQWNGRPPGEGNGRPPQWNGRPPGGNNGQPPQWNGRPPGGSNVAPNPGGGRPPGAGGGRPPGAGNGPGRPPVASAPPPQPRPAPPPRQQSRDVRNSAESGAERPQ
jgi:hypothetical protein